MNNTHSTITPNPLPFLDKNIILLTYYTFIEFLLGTKHQAGPGDYKNKEDMILTLNNIMFLVSKLPQGIRRGGEWDSFSVGQHVSLGIEAQVACLEDKIESRRQISWIILSLFHDSLLSIHWVDKQDQTLKGTGCQFFCSRRQISYYSF